MNSRHRATLTAIFAHPTRTDIRYADVASLFVGLGAQVNEGREGSRVGVTLAGVTVVVHRPHPRPVIGPATVRTLRRFLAEAGFEPSRG